MNDNEINELAGAPTERAWSHYQQAIFDAIEAPEGGSLLVEALAGTGKTTTICEAVDRVPGTQTVLVTAFNKAIAEELRGRLPGDVVVKTWHAFGYSNLPGRRLEQLKRGEKNYMLQLLDKQAARAAARGQRRWLQDRRARALILKLTGIGKQAIFELAQLRNAEQLPSLLDGLADACDLMFPKMLPRLHMCDDAAEMLLACWEHLRDPKAPITFDDMLWAPLVLELPIAQFDWVFVDEAQDLNPIQIALMLRAVKPGGRVVAVGDPHQAIYHFRGADAAALERVVKATHATRLPLSISYRCPRLVVAEAQELVPEFCAAPGAPEGLVEHCAMADLLSDARPGDFVISRTNAPLVELALHWLAQGKPARIRGRDVGAQLAELARELKAVTYADFYRRLQAWAEVECLRLEEAERETGGVHEKAAILRTIAKRADSGLATANASESVAAECESLFSDDSVGAIELMTAHKSKGLEARRVWILRDTFCVYQGLSLIHI